MEYTRAEIIEQEKQDLDDQIESARSMREMYHPTSDQWDYWDRQIDTLLAKKDALGEDLVGELPTDQKDWDFPPFPKDMPILDFDNIEEIPF